jgi:hypothetical protein
VLTVWKSGAGEMIEEREKERGKKVDSFYCGPTG